MTGFVRSAGALSDLAPQAFAGVAAAAGDVCLVVAADGRIVDAAVSDDELPKGLAEAWIGASLAAIVPANEHPKLEDLRAAAAGPAPARWRQLNLIGPRGERHLLLCRALRVHADGRMLVVGRSLAGTVRLQQSLVQAQQALEHDHWQHRDAQTRYRQLFEASSEGVWVLEADSLRVLEVNPAACRMLALQSEAVVGQPLPDVLGADADAVRVLLARVRTSGQAGDLRLLAGPTGPTGRATDGLRLSASAFRQSGSARLLVRLVADRGPTAAGDGAAPAWDDLVRAVPDALVLTDGDGRVRMANGAFLEMAQLGADEQLRGASLERWLERGSIDLGVLLSNLHQRGVVRLYATRLRGELGSLVDIEVAAVRVSESPTVLGYVMRDVGRRLTAPPSALQELPQSVAQLTQLVGRVPMKDIVGETSELIEQLCIDAALELTRGNRASAAELLGISRQSLYVKMRRAGAKELTDENEK